MSAGSSRSLMRSPIVATLLFVATGIASSAAVADRPDHGQIRLRFDTVADGFERPLQVTHAPDDSGRLYVVEQTGRIHSFLRAQPEIVEPFLDISDRVLVAAEAGLLGLTFHPDFVANGRMFVTYSRLSDGAAVVSEFEVTDGVVDPGAERNILVIDQPVDQHSIGTLAFDAQGMLIMGTGDGGGVGGDRARDPASLHGKLLRIDVDGPAPYRVPTDNGFAHDEAFRPEIHATGFRNPWRLSVDPVDGHIYVGDVGSIYWEEIDVLPFGRGGQDFGWNESEGPQCSHWKPACDVTEYAPPGAAYPHAPGSAVIGGMAYRGSEQPLLDGLYMFGDWGLGTIWGIPADELLEGSGSPQVIGHIGAGRLTSFGADEAGEPYAVDGARGWIMRVVAERESSG